MVNKLWSLFTGSIKIIVMVVTCVFIYSCVNTLEKLSNSEDLQVSSDQVGKVKWVKREYFDEFNEGTGEWYITNEVDIRGTFSNTATTNSPLYVSLLISSKDNIEIFFYEYNSKQPVKAISEEGFHLRMKGSDNITQIFHPKLYSDRLTFENNDSITIHEIFSKGGEVKFHFTDEEYSSRTYNFKVNFDEGYLEAFNSLDIK